MWLGKLVANLQNVISKLCLVPALHPSKSHIFDHRYLSTYTHVMPRRSRTDLVRTSFQPHYIGTYPILNHGDRTFDILVKGKKSTVSIGGLKPAYFISDPSSLTQRFQTKSAEKEQLSLLPAAAFYRFLGSLPSSSSSSWRGRVANRLSDCWFR